MFNFPMKIGLIGSTGFVGQQLLHQFEVTHRYRSTDINNIRGEHFDLLICAAPGAVKWQVNQDPEPDSQSIEQLQAALKSTNADRFVQISTVDVYPNPINVDESTVIEREGHHPYGLHRLQLEDFVSKTFSRHHIVRLPALFGKGLKKNFVYDLLNANALDWTHEDSEFQWYDLMRLGDDIRTALANNIKLLNITSEPIAAKELAESCFDQVFHNVTDRPPIRYDIRSQHAALFGGKDGYLYAREQIIQQLRSFLSAERLAKPHGGRQ